MLTLAISQQLGDLHLSVTQQLSTQGITAIFGLSGAGKTALINVVAGLTKPDYGHVQLNDRLLVDVEQSYFLPPEKRRIGYVFQDARLFPHYNVRGNLCYGMKKAANSHFDSVVQLLGIEPLLTRLPLALSGGEKQRVAIGRALLSQPELLLMDEPLAALDLPRKRDVLPYLERLAREVKIPILYVTHSMDEILRLADDVLLLERGQVRAYGDVEQVWASKALRPWLQQEDQCSVLQVNVIEHHVHYAMSAVALGEQQLWIGKLSQQVGESLRISIKASDVSLIQTHPARGSIRNILRAQIEDCLVSEATVDIQLKVEKHTLWSRITRWAYDELQLAAGQPIYAQVKSVSINRDTQ